MIKSTNRGGAASSSSVSNFQNESGLSISFAERMKSRRATLGLTQQDIARKTDLSLTTIRNYEGGQLPKGEHLVSLGKALQCSLDWLLTGDEAIEEKIEPVTGSWDQGNSVSIIGLASCGIEGWQNPSPISITATPPIISSQAIAVIAYGKSMIPAGIPEGRLLYCDPTLPPVKGDVVYICRSDGTASVKLFLGVSQEWVFLQGWLDPDSEGVQKPFTAKERKSHIVKIAPVVYSRHRL